MVQGSTGSLVGKKCSREVIGNKAQNLYFNEIQNNPGLKGSSSYFTMGLLRSRAVNIALSCAYWPKPATVSSFQEEMVWQVRPEFSTRS